MDATADHILNRLHHDTTIDATRILDAIFSFLDATTWLRLEARCNQDGRGPLPVAATLLRPGCRLHHPPLYISSVPCPFDFLEVDRHADAPPFELAIEGIKTS